MNIYKELENPQLAKRLMEMFCDNDLDWLCEELFNDKKEHNLCAENCNPDINFEECVVRYIKMQFRHEGKAV